LVNALSKMSAVGRCSITSTLGYDVAFIRETPTPTGRKILFVTNRRILFGEEFFDSRSKDYDLTVGELDLNDTDKKKSTGVLYPAAQLTINKQGELDIKLMRNPWKLVGILDWPGTSGLK
jgi:hypothetical protein